MYLVLHVSRLFFLSTHTSSRQGLRLAWGMSSQRISTRRAASGQSTPGATTSEPKKSDDAKPEKTERTPAAERAAEKAERAAE